MRGPWHLDPDGKGGWVLHWVEPQEEEAAEEDVPTDWEQTSEEDDD